MGLDDDITLVNLWDHDGYEEYESKDQKRLRKKEEKKKKVVREIIDLLRSEKTVGSCHGCPNVHKDAANFLAVRYKTGRVESDCIEHDHTTATTITLRAAISETPQFMSLINPDTNTNEIVRVVGVSDDRRKLQVIRG